MPLDFWVVLERTLIVNIITLGEMIYAVVVNSRNGCVAGIQELSLSDSLAPFFEEFSSLYRR